LTFNIDDSQEFFDVSEIELEDYDKKITQQRKNLKNNMESILSTNLNSDGSIEGNQITSEWFPKVKADVFISHSHNDLRAVKRIAVWLEKKMNLTAFIDSTVWGSADDLLLEIDNEYSILKYDKKGKPTYNYTIRNYTTAHVHMMLSTALMEMIDSTECLFFINTPHSIKLTDFQERKTRSPWIYNELKVARVVEKRKPKRYLTEEYNKILTSERIFKNYTVPEVAYDVSKELLKLNHLTRDDLYMWNKLFDENKSNQVNALDVLYLKHPVEKR